MIPEQFTNTRQLYERYKDFMQLLPPDYYDNIDFYGLDDVHGDEWTEQLNKFFSDEYNTLTEKEIYFEGCQHYIYLKFYNERLCKYIELHPDADESYFIREEYAAVNNMKAFQYGTEQQLTNQNIANDRRKEFLSERAKANGFTIGTFDTIISNETAIVTEQAPTVFGNHNYQVLHDMYDELKGLLPPNVSKSSFANTFLITDKPTDKIDFIGANISTFAYLIKNLHDHFTVDLRNKTIYNQWWADRFTFNGSERDKKGISTMCSAVRTGEKTPDKKGTIDEVLALFTDNLL